MTKKKNKKDPTRIKTRPTSNESRGVGWLEKKRGYPTNNGWSGKSGKPPPPTSTHTQGVVVYFVWGSNPHIKKKTAKLQGGGLVLFLTRTIPGGGGGGP